MGVNLATTHYKHVGSMKCWDQDGGGPLCFAAALAISPPLGHSSESRRNDDQGDWIFHVYGEMVWGKNAVNKESTW